MTTFNYVETVNNNLICCICRMPFIDPFTTNTCSHTFCHECIMKALDNASQCPVDRLPLQKDNLQQANPIVRSLVDELAVECENKPLGCTHTCQRQLMPTHVKNACLFAKLPCPNGNCQETILRKDEHQHNCSHILVPCNDCGLEVQDRELEAHQSACKARIVFCDFCNRELDYKERFEHPSICPEATIACTHTAHGCPWQGRRIDIPIHLESCTFHAIRGFLSIHQSRMDLLVEENEVLKRRVDALESLQRVNGRDMQAVKIALGPWYHNSQSAIPEQYVSAELPPSLQPSSASASHHMGEENVGEIGPSSTLSGHPDALASYFPAEDEILDFPRSPPLHSMSRPPNSYSATFGQGWDPSTSGLRQTFNNAVAPLNLSTTLEGSLEALRQSIVALSTSMDSLGRRSDIALTNETFRINEEIMSLKANVHGLRMQVHTILMDRNAQVTRRVQDSQESWLPSRLTGFPGSGTKL